MSQLHVVFGAGQIGGGLARALAARGHRVRVFRRSDVAVGDGIEVVTGDARDAAQAIAAAAGADVVYHCTNPSAYTGAAWTEEGPQLGDAAIAAALAADARLVVLDNLYAYGPVDGARTEDTPLRAEGPKGLQRAAWDARLREAAATDGLRYTVGRAGDFFGPGTGDHSLMSTSGFAGLTQGKPMLVVANACAPHAFSYAPDVVDGLAALGEADADVEGQVFHLPVVVASPRALVAAVADALGVAPRTRRMPAWAVRVLGVAVPVLYELRETLYQWEGPFLVDDSRFKARFAGVGSTLEEAAREIASGIEVCAAA